MRSKEQLIKDFETFLYELYGDVKIEQNYYSVAEVLKLIDPNFYREKLLKWGHEEYLNFKVTKGELNLL